MEKMWSWGLGKVSVLRTGNGEGAFRKAGSVGEEPGCGVSSASSFSFPHCSLCSHCIQTLQSWRYIMVAGPPLTLRSSCVPLLPPLDSA